MPESILEAIAPAIRWTDDGQPVALATVTRTWGSAPRQAGSQMAVRGDGAFAGSVSGGCVETAVIGEARAAIADGKVRNLRYGVSNEQAWEVGLACGGTIEVHVAPVNTPAQREILKSLERAQAEKAAAVLASDLAGQEWRLIYPNQEGGDALAQAAARAARHDESGQVEIAGRNWFLTVLNPPLDLALVGAVHIAQPLAGMAKRAGYDVRVIDPRTHFSTRDRFPDVNLVHEWPDEALDKAPLGPRSALVALTHDPKLDDPALVAAVRSPAFYVGALGSRQTHARRLERLAAAGLSQEDLARIRGPVGLDIGARTPAEIAIAILAEMTKTLRME